MMEGMMEPEEIHKSKKPKHNKLRVVFATNDSGHPVSYIHLQHSEARRIFTLIDYLKDKPDPILISQIMKDTKITYSSLIMTLRIMAGAKWIDMQEDGAYKKLLNRTIYITKGLMHKDVNLPYTVMYLKAPYYVQRAPL